MKFTDLFENKQNIQVTKNNTVVKPLQQTQAQTVKPVVKATKKNLKQYSIMDILRASNIKIKNVIPSDNAISIELYTIPSGIDIILRDIDYYIVGNAIIIRNI